MLACRKILDAVIAIIIKKKKTISCNSDKSISEKHTYIQYTICVYMYVFERLETGTHSREDVDSNEHELLLVMQCHVCIHTYICTCRQALNYASERTYTHTHNYKLLFVMKHFAIFGIK